MKKSILSKAAALTVLTLSLVPAQGGFIGILRGNEKPAAPEYQRVAFIGSAEVREVQGRAERLVGIEQWKPLKPGDELKPGDVIRSENGTVLLRMRESQSFVKVTPKTILRLVPLQKGWDLGILTGREESNGFVVRSCRGKALFKDGAGEWKPVLVNMVLKPSTALRTEPGAVLDLFSTEQKQAWRIEGGHQVSLTPTVLAAHSRAAAPLLAAGGGR